jgi:hypothetical protein
MVKATRTRISAGIILRIFRGRDYIRVRERPSRFSHTGRSVGAAETNPDAVPSIHVAARQRILLSDQPHAWPGQGTEWRTVRVWLGQRHSRFEGDLASVTNRHSHDIRNDNDIRMTLLIHSPSMTYRHQHALDFRRPATKASAKGQPVG